MGADLISPKLMYPERAEVTLQLSGSRASWSKVQCSTNQHPRHLAMGKSVKSVYQYGHLDRFRHAFLAKNKPRSKSKSAQVSRREEYAV